MRHRNEMGEIAVSSSRENCGRSGAGKHLLQTRKGWERMVGTIVLSAHLEHLMTTLGMTYTELARAMGTSDRTVMRWLADETYPQHDARAKLDELTTLVQRLDESFKTPQGPAMWLRARSGYFGDLAPLDALLSGRIDAVDAALEALDAGVFV